MIASSRENPTVTSGPLRIQAVGLSAPVAARVDAILGGTEIGGSVRSLRFQRPGQKADVLLVAEPARAAEVADMASSTPSSHIIVIVEQASPAAARRLLEAGADGVLASPDLDRELVPAIEAVAAGLVCLSASSRNVAVVPALSIRERQVLALMSGGLSNAEIADRLYLSESTVKSHASRAFRRLGVHSRREAVALVLGSDEALRRSVLMSHPSDAPPGEERRRGGGR
jgi:DNA-binding CsgD family transcriptional regulator